MEICVLSVLPVCAKQALTPTIPSDWQPHRTATVIMEYLKRPFLPKEIRDVGIEEVRLKWQCFNVVWLPSLGQPESSHGRVVVNGMW